jgi:predicted PurR-regulated permease PerM
VSHPRSGVPLLGTPGGLSSWVRGSAAFPGWVSTLGQVVAHHLFIISFSVVFLHFAYRDGDGMVTRLDRFLRGTIGDSVAPYLELIVRAVRAMVVSMVAVALFSGVLTGIIYAVGGVQHAAVWGAVTGLFAMIPYLGYVVVAGVACARGRRRRDVGVGGVCSHRLKSRIVAVLHYCM